MAQFGVRMAQPNPQQGTNHYDYRAHHQQDASPLNAMGGSPQGMGGSPQGMGGSTMGMGTSPMGMGGTSMGIGGSQMGMGGSRIGMGGSPMGMGGSTMGMGGSPMGMGGSPMGMGGSLMGMGGSPMGMGSSQMGMGGLPMGLGGSSPGLGATPLGMDDQQAQGKRAQREQFVRSNSQLVDTGEVNVFLANCRVTFDDGTSRVKKVEIGQPEPGCREKVIMIVGATGSGKSTLINGMFNYVLGVDWRDDYRLKMVQEGIQGQEANQAKSQTTYITAYTIHHLPWFQVPYTLTIIDTPGFGDTAGIQRDQEITNQIKACFTTKGPSGVDSLDAVGFVAQSALPRLTPSQRYIFDSILSLFGKDIGDNIIMLLTFADGQKPQVLAGIEEAQMPYKKFFKFNNSALYVSNKGTMEVNEVGADENFDEMFWKMGKKSFKTLMADLDKIQKKSLVLTKDVLEERSRLEVTVEGIQKDVKVGLNKLEQLRVEHMTLDHHQSDIDKNRNFTYYVDEQVMVTEQTSPGQYVTNCVTCNMTCHEHCIYPNDEDKAKCSAMGYGPDGKSCRICPMNCYWDMHRNMQKVYVVKIHTVKKTSGDLKKKYEDAKKEKLTAEQLVQEIQDEFDEVQFRVLEMVDQARRSIDRLNEIALRTNPLSTVDYIDILITSEKSEAKPGWMERVDQLMAVKKKAEQMQQIAQQGYDPFEELKKKYAHERQQRQLKRSQQVNP